VEVFEKRCAALEGGSAAVACASGQSALFQTIVMLANSGDNIISSINLYGGSYSLFKTLLPRLGITVRWAPTESPEEIASLIDERTKMVYVETIGNPRCSVPDLRGISDVAHAQGVPFVVDNTFGACGAFCRVLDHGADLVVHSATKWMGGHGTTVGGVVIDGGRFDWGASASKYPHLTDPDGPMGFSYWKEFGPIAFAFALRINVVMEVGSVLNPFAAQQLLIGLETLSLRCDRIASNTLAVARFLDAHDRVSWVNYPGLENDTYHAFGRKYLTGGYGGVLAFGIRGGSEASNTVINSIKLVSHMTNVGDSKTMATHPWSSTHVIMSEDERLRAGVTPDLIRFSVGTEDVQDLIEDLAQALAQIPQNLLEKAEATNGIKSEPKVNGSVNGKENGYTNGHTNGSMNGHSNGHINGEINDYTNGHTNGDTNGYANGHINGHKNGCTNGYNGDIANGSHGVDVNGGNRNFVEAGTST
jgi:O-acetylhomoserine/O-acetylserine sulfhydrylase